MNVVQLMLCALKINPSISPLTEIQDRHSYIYNLIGCEKKKTGKKICPVLSSRFFVLGRSSHVHLLRARNCDSLVANATRHLALATSFLELVAKLFNLGTKCFFLVPSWRMDGKVNFEP